MKKLILSLLLSCFVISSLQAQDDPLRQAQDEEKGFKKENLFTGGSVTVSFFNRTTILGASPIFGYRLANWIDGGAVINFTYSSQRDYPAFNDKIRQSVYGGGLFTRLFPVNFLFVQGQFEHNFSKLKYIPATSYYNPYSQTVEANSFLVGAGYTQGRGPGSNTFYYLSVLFDVIKNENSPYVDVVIDQATGQKSVRAVPLIRAGINIGLFEGRGSR